MTKPGRNEPCPCGSGRKYKKCCLQRDAASAPSNLLDMAYEAFLKIRSSADEKLFKAMADSVEAEYAREVSEELQEGPFLYEGEYDKLYEGTDAQNRLLWVHQQAMLALYRGGNEESVLEAVLKKHPSRFTNAEVRFLRDRDAAPFSCYQFREFFPEQGVVMVEDILEGVVYRLFDKTLSREGILNGICTGRLLPFPERDGYVMESLMPSVIEPGRKEQILEMLAHAVGTKAVGSKAKPMIKERLALDPIGVFWLELYNCYQQYFPTLPKLVNRDGHELADIKAEFSFTDSKRAAAKLLSLPGFMLDDKKGPVVVWLNKEDTLLARIVFDKRKGIAIAELNSQERFRKLKKLLKPLEPLKYLSMTEKPMEIEEMQRRMAQAGPAPQKSKPEFSPEEMREISGQVFSKWEKDWLTQKIPALGGKTPKQAARSEAGREQLRNLLDDFEFKNARQGPDSPMHYFNLDPLRKKLGVE